MLKESEEQDGIQAVRTWYVLHVKPRMEKRVLDYLSALRVFRHLPLVKKVSKVQRRKVTRYLPLFPGYVFTRLDQKERVKVLETQRVVQMIVVRQPRQMIHQLRQIAHAGGLPTDIRKVEVFTAGEYVKVKSGPLRGVEGYVKREGSKTSIVLVVDILGQAVETTVDPQDLERSSCL